MRMIVCCSRLIYFIAFGAVDARREDGGFHAMNSGLLNLGQYHSSIDDLKADKEEFFKYFRMCPDTFKELLDLLTPHIQKKDTRLRKSICA